MDTHRRSSGAVAAAAGAGVAADSAAAIYSGLELARLAAAGQQAADSGEGERHAAVFPKPIGTYRTACSVAGPMFNPGSRI
jgi:hypothetical protein